VPVSPDADGFTPLVTPIRVAFIGVGRVYDLNVRAYRDNPDVEVVAIVDVNEERRSRALRDWPHALAFATIDDLVASAVDIDAVEILLPTVLHEVAAIQCLEAGWHVNLQKPKANDLASAERMVNAARTSQRALRVMENYLFYEPLVRLKEVVDSGELGRVSGYHLKMVASGRGGWEVSGDTYQWQFDQAKLGRGVLVFDDGWHKLSTALWLFGPIREVRAWVGATQVIPDLWIDAPTTLIWEHDSGIRGVWDVTLAPEMYLRSDYYTNDERWEVTGERGFARVNRCTGRGIQEPSLEVYLDGVTRSYHALDDDWASSFRDSGRHWLRWLQSGQGPLWWGAADALDVLRLALAAYESDARGGVGVKPSSL